MSIISRVFPHTSSKQSKLGQKDATGIQQVKVTVTPMMGFHAKDGDLTWVSIPCWSLQNHLTCPWEFWSHFRITWFFLQSKKTLNVESVEPSRDVLSHPVVFVGGRKRTASKPSITVLHYDRPGTNWISGEFLWWCHLMKKPGSLANKRPPFIFFFQNWGEIA